MKTLGDIIKEFREKHSMSMEEFARISKLSKGYISMLERNVNPQTNKPITPTFETIKNISKAMNADINDLLEVIGDQIIKINVMQGDEILKEDETEYQPFSSHQRIIKLLGEEVVSADTGINVDNYTEEELDKIADRLLEYARLLGNDKKLDK